MHVDHVSAKPFARNLKAQEGACAVLEERVDLGQPLKPAGIFMCLPIKRHPLLGLIEQIADLMRLQTSDAKQVAMRKKR
jgi:hypothetical protein